MRKNIRREVISANFHSVSNKVRNNIFAEIMMSFFLHCVVVKCLFKNFALENVISHRDIAESRLAWNFRRVLRLLHELDNSAVLVSLDAAKFRSICNRYNISGYRYVSMLGHVPRNHLVNVHLVNMICGKNTYTVCSETRNHMLSLIYCVSCALIPMFSAPHLRWYRRYEEVPAPHCSAELPASFNMFHE